MGYAAGMLSAPIVLAVFVLMLAGCGLSQARPQGLDYRIGLDQAAAQLVDIEMTIPAWDRPTLDLRLPVWRPGRYEVLDLAGGIRTFEAVGPDRKALAWDKVDKSTWRVHTPTPGDVVVRYQLYCNSLSSRTRHADDSHVFLSGAAAFLYCHERRAAPITVQTTLPEGWRIATGLEPGGARPGTLVARDYDTLVDSPQEIGVHELREAVADGVTYQIAAWGRTEALPAAFAADCAKIAAVQQRLFGGAPFSRYVFITHITPGGGGGTEHLNSTVIGAKPSAATSASDYRGLLALASHELFHAWNVKQFRPQGLKPYDYQRENYTDLLWVAEGSTSYYDELLCVRAGVWEPKHLLESLAKTIDAELSRPGGGVQSLQSSSFDAWIKFNKPTPDAVNSTVSFYSKGALVTLLLDAEVRSRTGGASSMDDVMRTLYQRFPLGGPAYSTDDLRQILEGLTSSDFGPFLRDYVRGTTPLPLEQAVGVYGLELRRDGDANAGAKAYLGLDLKDTDGLAGVTAVRADGPAVSAGVNVDDLIVAINGVRLRAADLDSRLSGLKPGDSVRVTYLRREVLREATITLGERPKGELKLTRVKEPTAAQKAAYEHWLGCPWDR